MAHAAQRQQASIDVSDPQLYQDDTWRPLFEQLRRDGTHIATTAKGRLLLDHLLGEIAVLGPTASVAA